MLSKYKKIGLFLDSGPACGGAYQYSRIILEALKAAADSHFQMVVYFSEPHWEPVLSRIHCEAVLISSQSLWRKGLGLWRRLHLPVILYRAIARRCHPLAKKMYQEQCDVWIFPSQDAWAYWLPVPALATIHDLMHRYEPQFPEVGCRQEQVWREFHYQHLCKFAKGILVDSELGRNHVVQSYGFSKERCHVLPYIAPKGISTTYFKNFDQDYPLPKKFIFYPAQFWEHKNHINLLKAIYKCKNQGIDLHCVLVGSPKNGYEAVQAKIKELHLTDHISHFGLVPDEAIPEFYRRAHALVMPTFFGPTNIPPLEAFALNCPVAVSNIYAMPEQLGDAALFFDPHSVDEISACMVRLWEDEVLCASLKRKGQEKYQAWQFEQFSLEFQNILRKI